MQVQRCGLVQSLGDDDPTKRPQRDERGCLPRVNGGRKQRGRPGLSSLRFVSGWRARERNETAATGGV